jgi:ABC-type multidrug transport system fused ATPase/permease subunit
VQKVYRNAQEFVPFWNLVKPILYRLRWSIAASISVVLIATTLQVLAPLALKEAINHLTNKTFDAAAVATACYVGIGFAVRAGQTFQFLTLGYVWRPLQRSLLVQVFSHIVFLPHAFFLAHPTGAITRIVYDAMSGTRSIYIAFIFRIVPAIFQALLICTVLLLASEFVVLTIFVIFSLTYGYTFHEKSKKERTAQRSAAETDVLLAGVVTDNLINQEPLKLFAAQGNAAAEIDTAARMSEHQWLAYFRSQLAHRFLLNAITTTALFAVLIFSASQVVHGGMTLGAFVLMNAYMLQIIAPIENVGEASREFEEGIAYIRNVTPLLREAHEPIEGGESLPTSCSPMAVTFDDISFSYDGKSLILQNIDLEIGQGQTIAIVGPSGSGKSTLMRLILRLYDPCAGRLLIDGVPIAQLNLRSLREAIAAIPQDVILFNTTIAQNILVGRPDATSEDLDGAVKLAGLREIVQALPLGLDTVVGERGLRISGGQRQRIAVARAIIRRPRLFVFDEPTSSLDAHTENVIKNSFSAMSREATMILITHRLSSVTTADMIVFMDQGRIIERGTHKELLQGGNHYAKMWAVQDASRSEEFADDRSDT